MTDHKPITEEELRVWERRGSNGARLVTEVRRLRGALAATEASRERILDQKNAMVAEHMVAPERTCVVDWLRDRSLQHRNDDILPEEDLDYLAECIEQGEHRQWYEKQHGPLPKEEE